MKTLIRNRFNLMSWILCAAMGCSFSHAADMPDRTDVESALKKAATYFATRVATNGGYLWVYSLDFKERRGEGEATETQIWVQPPGTPAVGLAFMTAWRATGDRYYLDAATSAARALAWGQLACGGWDYKIDFAPKAETRWRYYHNENKSGPKGRRNVGTFDDNNSQSALRCLMAVDKATSDPAIHAAVERGIAFFIEAQFDNGAWPQRYPLASSGYSPFYTFNDNTHNDCIETMWEAWETYGRKDCRESALKGGRFIIDSQLDPPQSGWAQQHDHDMKPAPARWFEPASCCSAVTARNIGTLVDLYLWTGDTDFLKPIPAAFEWLERVKLPSGLYARFYEVGTDRPIYFTADQKLTYETKNLRPGYSWQGEYGAASQMRRYREVTEKGREAWLQSQNRPLTADERARRARQLAPAVRQCLDSLDPQGRWVRDDHLSCRVFIANLRLLSSYLESTR